MSTISTLPPAPSRSDPATFSDKADALLGALDGFVSETNVVVGEVLANKDTAVASAATATTQASNASTSASTASTQASNASSSASSASTSASTATTQAGIATAAASTATTQAGIATAAAASINLASPAAIGNVTPNTGAFTTLAASGTVSGAGFTARFASPGPIGSTTPSTGAFTTLSASGNILSSGGTVASTYNTTGIPNSLFANTTAGAANGAAIEARADESGGIRLTQTSTTYNTAPIGPNDPPNIASAGTLSAPRAGGINIVAANGTIKMYAGSTSTVSATVSSTGLAVTGTLSATGQISGRSSNGTAFAAGNGVDTDLTVSFSSTHSTLNNSAGDIQLQIAGTNRAVVSSAGVAVTGAVSASGLITSNNNTGGFVANRALVTNFTGVGFRTNGAQQWFLGLRENLSSNNLIVYNEILGTDAITLNVSTNSITTAGSLAVTGKVQLTDRGSSYAFTTPDWNIYNGTSGNTLVFNNGSDQVTLTSAGVLSLTQGQIKFPATAVPSADANTLDDYEEGTWTPVIAGSTVAGSGTYSTQNGQYTKKGREVTCLATINWSAHTGTGNMLLTGLPFSVGGALTPISSATCASLTITGQLILELPAGTSGGVFYAVNNGTLSSLALDTSATVYLQFIYNV